MTNIPNSKKLVCIENTKFIYNTNFSGDPERDRFGSDARQANIIIPDEAFALDLLENGFNVKVTKPRPEDEDYVPTYFVPIKLIYDSNWPPKVYLVVGDDVEPKLLDEESIDTLDYCRILSVDAVLNPYHNPRTGKSSLYVQTMYVVQDIESDPYANKWMRR